MLALCFLAAQWSPQILTVAAASGAQNFTIICTADGFKKVPLSELGLDRFGFGGPQQDIPNQDCPVCVLICASSVSDLTPQVAIVWAPIPPTAFATNDDHAIAPQQAYYERSASPRGPPPSS